VMTIRSADDRAEARRRWLSLKTMVPACTARRWISAGVLPCTLRIGDPSNFERICGAHAYGHRK